MRQRGRQQENEERNSDIEQQSSPQNDGVDPTSGRIIFKYWHAMYVVSCVIAVLCVDPLFLYLPVINQDHKCLALDRRLKITVICIRSVFDLVYLVNIILGFLCPYKDEDASRRCERTVLVTGARQIAKRYLSSYFIIDILAILPIPQVLVPFTVSKMTSSEFFEVRKFQITCTCVLLQYVPRVLRIYLSYKIHIEISGKLVRRVWIKAAFNFFIYILASHVFGASWYFFSIEREMACWHKACENHIGCSPSSFKCSCSLGNHKFLDDACSIQTPNAAIVDFGMFLEALQHSIISSTNIPQKIMHCFWWGLRNLSSLGQNLQTSTYFGENCFAVFITIFGLLLFLYFIGHVQTYIQMATKKSETKAEKLKMEAENLKMAAENLKMLKMEAEKSEAIKRKMRPIKFWITRNQLPSDMTGQIISHIQHKFEENKDFDIEKPVPQFPSYLAKEIKRHLCLPLLRKVQILNNESEYLLRLICESLKPLYYNENNYIFREGEPLNAMIFITQGSLWCFKTNNGENGEGTASTPQCIEKGEFYGEELLEWELNLPISTKTVKTLTKVEAFALTADKWKILVSRRSQAAFQAASIAKRFAQAIRGRLNEKMNEIKFSQNGLASSIVVEKQ